MVFLQISVFITTIVLTAYFVNIILRYYVCCEVTLYILVKLVECLFFFPLPDFVLVNEDFQWRSDGAFAQRERDAGRPFGETRDDRST